LVLLASTTNGSYHLVAASGEPRQLLGNSAVGPARSGGEDPIGSPFPLAERESKALSDVLADRFNEYIGLVFVEDDARDVGVVEATSGQRAIVAINDTEAP
jgi:hypothetical protein